jgi:hypothetical protein
MAHFLEKQPSSRPVKYQVLTYSGGSSGGASVQSTNFHASTQHIRVISTLQGYFSIDDNTASSTVVSSVPTGRPFKLPDCPGFHWVALLISVM